MANSSEVKKIVNNFKKKQKAVEERALEVFSQLCKLPEFNKWMRDHIMIRDEVDDLNRKITTYVIYRDSDVVPSISPPPSPEELPVVTMEDVDLGKSEEVS
jgi:hypothetical protein